MVKNQIKAIIAEITGYGTEKNITMGLSFEEDFEMDEFDFDELLETLEEEFNVELTPYASKFVYVRDLIDFIQEGL